MNPTNCFSTGEPIFVPNNQSVFNSQTIVADRISTNTLFAKQEIVSSIKTETLSVNASQMGLSTGSLNVQGSFLYWNSTILGASTGGNAPTWSQYVATNPIQANSQNITGISSIGFIDSNVYSGKTLASKQFVTSTISAFVGPFVSSVSFGNNDLLNVNTIQFQSGTGVGTLDVLNNGTDLTFNGEKIYPGQNLANWATDPASSNINANLNSLLSAQSLGIQTNGSNLNTIYTNSTGLYITRGSSNYAISDGSNGYVPEWSQFGAGTNVNLNNSTIQNVKSIGLGTSNYPLTAVGGNLTFAGATLSQISGSNWYQYTAAGNINQQVDFGQMGINIAKSNSLLYPNSVVNTNIKMGTNQAQLIGPTIEMYPHSVILGSPANPIGGTFSITTGAGLSWYSGTTMNFQCLQGFNFTGAGINLTGANIAVSGGGIEVTGGAINVLGGLMNVEGGNLLVTTGAVEITSGDLLIGSGLTQLVSGNLAILAGDVEIGAGSLIIGTIASAGAGVEIYGGDINIYQVAGTAAGINVHAGGAVTTNLVVEGDSGSLNVGTPMSSVLNKDTVYLNHISSIRSEKGMNITGVKTLSGTSGVPLNISNVSSIVGNGGKIAGFSGMIGDGSAFTISNLYALQNSNNAMNITGVQNITGSGLLLNNPGNDLKINGLSSITCANGSQITGLGSMAVSTLKVNTVPYPQTFLTQTDFSEPISDADTGKIFVLGGFSATTFNFIGTVSPGFYCFLKNGSRTSGFVDITISVNGTQVGGNTSGVLFATPNSGGVPTGNSPIGVLTYNGTVFSMW